jgi:hypothetical protein
MKSYKITRVQLALFFILIVAAFFRFWNGPARYGLGNDSSRDAFIALVGARELQLPLTGPFSSFGPFTFGPWYYYQLIAFTAITRVWNAPWIYLGIASLIFIIVMYKLAKRLGNAWYGLIVAALIAVSPPQITTAKGLTNPNLISVFAGLSLYLFVRHISDIKYSPYLSLIWGIILGIGTNIHYQMVNLLILPVIVWLKNPRRWQTLALSGLGCFITFLPMLFFELNNHWYTLRNMTYLYIHRYGLIYVPNRWLTYLTDFWPNLWSYDFGIPNRIGIIFGLLTSGIIGYALFKRQLSLVYKLIITAFIIHFIMLRYYWGERFVGYMQYLNPYIFLFGGFIFWQMINKPKLKIFGLITFIITISLMIPASIRELKPDINTIPIWNDVAGIEKQYPQQKFQIYNYKREDWDRAQAIAYLLYSRKLLSKDGIPLGICKEPCNLPPIETINPESEITVDVQLQKKLPVLSFANVRLLTEASPTALVTNGWAKVDEHTIYDRTVKWWYQEQP